MPSVISCKLLARKSDQARATQDVTNRGPRVVTERETWRVIYDGYVTAITALTAAGLPQCGHSYSGLVCVGVNPIRVPDNINAFDVLIDYTSLTSNGGVGTFNVNVKKSTATREQTAVEDQGGLPLVNTVGDLLPQLPNETYCDAVYSVTWSASNLASWATGSNAGTIEGKVNSGTVNVTICGFNFNWDVNQAKILVADADCTKTLLNAASGTIAATYNFIYNHTLAFQIRRPSWVWNAPNEGWRGSNNTDTGLQRFKDDGTTLGDGQGTPSVNPTKMDLEGFALPNGTAPLILPGDAEGLAVPNGCRTYAATNGAFVIPKQTDFSGLFTGLTD